MPIDSSIYGQVQAPDFLGNYEKLERISSMSQDRKLKDQAAQMEQQKALMERKAKEADLIARAAPLIKDQQSWTDAKLSLGKLGVDTSQMGDQYDPNFVKVAYNSALTVKDQLGQQNRDQEFKYGQEKDNRTFANQDREFGLQKEKFGFDKTDKNRDYEIKLANMGLSKEQFEENKNQNAVKNSLAERELEMIKNDKNLSQTAKQKYLDAMLKKAQGQGSGKSAELSVAEAKQLGLYKSGMLANQQYEDALAKGDYDPTSYMAIIDNSSFAPQGLKSSSAQSAQAAEDAWVESFLRDASGAAIPATERGPYKDQFFARKGDSPEVLKNKAALRAQKMENARVASGIDGDPQTMQAQQPRPQAIPDANALNQLPDDELMKLYRQMGGQ